MTLTHDEIVQILKLIEESTFDELHLETGDLKLHIRKQGCGTSEVEINPPLAGPASVSSESSPSASARAEKDGITTGTVKTSERPATGDAGLLPIKAPLLGTIYRRPAPESPAYVEVGSLVKEEDTVCLIEVMKVFTAVKAGIRGRITQVLVETNELVEYGQPLFLVKPEAGPV